jgi:hypothetical protein
MSGSAFHLINSPSFSLLPPSTKWVGLREIQNIDGISSVELCWGDPYRKNLEKNSFALPTTVISDVKVGCSHPIKIRGVFKTHLAITFILTDEGASLLEKINSYHSTEFILCAKEIEDLLDLYLSVKYILRSPTEHHAAFRRLLDQDSIVNAHQEFDSTAAMQSIQDNKLKDEELQAQVFKVSLPYSVFMHPVDSCSCLHSTPRTSKAHVAAAPRSCELPTPAHQRGDSESRSRRRPERSGRAGWSDRALYRLPSLTGRTLGGLKHAGNV